MQDKLDKNGNYISVTLFESYLSKCLVELPEKYFKPVFVKLLMGVKEVIELNRHDRGFDRLVFVVDSLMYQRFKDYKGLVNLIELFDVFMASEYLKIFSDSILKNGKIQHYPKEEPSHGLPSLKSLCKLSMFKDLASKQSFQSFLKPDALFLERNRGAILKSKVSKIRTRKLGVCTIANTPSELLHYFPHEEQPAQLDFVPDRKSNVGRWLMQLNLPIISGTSGSARDFLELSFSFAFLNREETQLMMVALAAVMVAKGHHSYFEVMIMMDRTGCKLKLTDDLYSFYEQTIPQSILESEEFQAFKESKSGAQLLDGFDCHNHKAPFQELPVFSSTQHL